MKVIDPNPISFEDDSNTLKSLPDLHKELASRIIDNMINEDMGLKMLYDSFFLLSRYRDTYLKRKEEILEVRKRREIPSKFCLCPIIHVDWYSTAFHFNFSHYPCFSLKNSYVEVEWSDGKKPLGYDIWRKWHEGKREVVLNQLWNKFIEVEKEKFEVWKKGERFRTLKEVMEKQDETQKKL